MEREDGTVPKIWADNIVYDRIYKRRKPLLLKLLAYHHYKKGVISTLKENLDINAVEDSDINEYIENRIDGERIDHYFDKARLDLEEQLSDIARQYSIAFQDNLIKDIREIVHQDGAQTRSAAEQYKISNKDAWERYQEKFLSLTKTIHSKIVNPWRLSNFIWVFISGLVATLAIIPTLKFMFELLKLVVANDASSRELAEVTEITAPDVQPRFVIYILVHRNSCHYSNCASLQTLSTENGKE